MNIIKELQKQISINKILNCVHTLNFSDFKIVNEKKGGNNKEHIICYYTNNKNEYIRIAYINMLNRYKYTIVKNNKRLKEVILNLKELKTHMYFDSVN